MKTALIVGASRGLGLEFARQYVKAGWRVLATARSEASLAELRALGAQTYELDIANPDDIEALGSKLDGERLDVALIVSGVYGPRTEGVEAISAEDFEYVMNTNVRGPMQIIPILLPLVDAAHGVLAVLSSRMGSITQTTGTTGWLYRASKAALNDVLKITSLQTRRATCIALHPGWVRTDMGGAHAAIDASASVAGMREVIAEAAAAREVFNGRFFQYDGTELDW
ncbi:NAD(P)-dependent dehydrogenase (short-subunit alcohol dehydrogenase family) [Paraburkholderia bannensis]|uniref:NAD(P)-dependent dehydrogenase (Short-subunit alcohol dehydrogenase family) n=1 Tax=Paraburkholderia bannensis TaxID=765414 RepID=A0A7W9WQE8_9BURK|nr:MULTISPECIES: SDR family oxidoreductase [Paraburkholderia]MBB3255505.1 NAD(P)-dependent dehydrogenase (short-subunit alcohol dehydrogenase family) [Paraburkholderia sp. WP4_3_2]MBB6100484.1 NAD(P)-dependent dehydrogenase (short-subunit alcohol dehydrogenase family) [Paraburkholderia bannensis]